MLQSIAARQIEECFISTYKYRHSQSYAVVTFQKVFYKSSFVEVKLSIHTVNCVHKYIYTHTHTHTHTHTGVQLKSKLKHIGTSSAAIQLFYHLCYHPAVFF